MKKKIVLLALSALGVSAFAQWRPLSQLPSITQTKGTSARREFHKLSMNPKGQQGPSQNQKPVFRLEGAERITSVKDSRNPLWSPIDPKELAFVAPDGTYVGTIETNAFRKVTSYRAGFKFAWTKDGNYLIFRDWIDDQQMAIKSMAVQTGEVKTLGQSTDLSLPQEVGPGVIEFTDSGFHRLIGLSEPEKTSTVLVPFVYQRDDNILVRAANDTRQITTDAGKYFLPQLSPDGTKVLYQEISRGLYVADLMTNTTVYLGLGDDAAWSPDSRYIVFEVTSDRNESIVGSELYLTDLAGERTQLTNTDGSIETRPSWSSDGKHLAFEADGYIYVATLVRLGETRQ